MHFMQQFAVFNQCCSFQPLPYQTHAQKKKNIYIAGNFLHAAGIAANAPP